MRGLFDRICIYVCCMSFMIISSNDRYLVVELLLLLLFSCLGLYFEDMKLTSIAVFLYGTYCLYQPICYLSLPLVIYEMVNIYRQAYETKDRLNIILSVVDTVILGTVVLRHTADYSVTYNLVLGIVTGIAVLLNIYSDSLWKLKHRLIVERDSSRELTLALKDKNHYLIEKQDTEIHMATLKERNRIAREIHDNVGHMLSRSILLTGAMSAVNKDESLTPMISSLSDTLNGAMNSIRQSVHDLHDESIDLKSAVQDLLTQLKDYNVNFDYDMGSEVPRNIKYCLISIVKESVTNIMKHSDATHVDIIMVEHPSFYQLQVNDNGKCIKKGDGSGIGLQNIRDRVESFHGTLNITSDRGYKIFVNIPKEVQNNESNRD